MSKSQGKNPKIRDSRLFLFPCIDTLFVQPKGVISWWQIFGSHPSVCCQRSCPSAHAWLQRTLQTTLLQPEKGSLAPVHHLRSVTDRLYLNHLQYFQWLALTKNTVVSLGSHRKLAPRPPAFTKICVCLSPFYRMVWYLPITYVYFHVL